MPEEVYPNRPFSIAVDIEAATITNFTTHIQRRLSAMRGQYRDVAAYEDLLAQEDCLLYQVYAIDRPSQAGELPHGLSIIHPGKVGSEYFMTKGHFHAILETGEVYNCLRGHGMIVMETPEGEWAVEELWPGRILYIPPRWAHRSVNTSADEDFVFHYVYPGDAGHDYGTIEQLGFRKLVVEENGQPSVVDNPRWRAPEQR